LDAAVGLNTLSYYDENNIIVCSKKKVLLFNLKNMKISKTYNVEEPGSIIGTFKKNK